MKILLLDFNNILTDVDEELRRRGHTVMSLHKPDGSIVSWKDADVIVVWQETELGGWREMVLTWQRAGKTVVLMQHGRRGTSRIFPPFNERLVSDRLCVWGENDVRRMTTCGVPREKIYVTGTPVVKHIKPRIPHKGINVVFSPEHWDTEVPENFAVRNELRKIVSKRWFWQPKMKVITKILQNEHDPRNYDNPVPSDRQMPGHIDIAIEVLRRADVVVAVSESTFELLAEIMDIPVVIADIWVPKACAGDDRYKKYQREYSEACTRVKLDKLEDAINYALRYPQYLREERQKIGILDGGTDIEDPVDEIIKVITNDENTGRSNPQRSRTTDTRPHHRQGGVRRRVRRGKLHGSPRTVRKGGNRNRGRRGVGKNSRA